MKSNEWETREHSKNYDDILTWRKLILCFVTAMNNYLNLTFIPWKTIDNTKTVTTPCDNSFY